MPKVPKIEQGALVLRAFRLEDAPKVAEYCGDWDLAKTTANIPHPYDQSMARGWIASHQEAFEAGEAATFAITLADSGELVGAVGLQYEARNQLAEIGYWIGKPHWGNGYATSAAQAIIEFGFSHWDLNRVQARHITTNPASGRVMEKAGMQLEGVLRQASFRWGTFEDLAIYSILKEEFEPIGVQVQA